MATAAVAAVAVAAATGVGGGMVHPMMLQWAETGMHTVIAIGVTVLFVVLAGGIICENFVSLCDLNEHVLSLCSIGSRILVRVVQYRQLTVRLLHLFGSRTLFDAQDGVRVERVHLLTL